MSFNNGNRAQSTINSWNYPVIVLASQSPRRRELLAQIGVPHEVVKVSVDESVLAGEEPLAYVQRVALSKAKAGVSHRSQRSLSALPVIGADTAVVIDGEILGKPNSQDHARQMLRRLSGNTHEVITSVALLTAATEAAECVTRQKTCVSQVTFREISDAEIAAYWATGEPLDKAGGYAIQGLGAVFVQQIMGSYSGVMGLPVYETAELLRQLANVAY